MPAMFSPPGDLIAVRTNDPFSLMAPAYGPRPAPEQLPPSPHRASVDPRERNPYRERRARQLQRDRDALGRFTTTKEER